MLLEISALLAAAAFAVLVFYLIQTLLSAKRSLERAADTLEQVQQTVNLLSGDLQGVAKNANELSLELSEQLKKMEPVMDSVQHAGEALNEISIAAKQVSVGLVKGVRRAAGRFEREPIPDRRAPKEHQVAAAPAPVPEPLQADTAAITQEPPGEAGHKQEREQSPQGQGRSHSSVGHQQDWKEWIDIGTKLWQLWRQRA
ncbi:hypothetical protein AZ66_23965 [Paenibacillus sp. E194]|uniref:DUF948 domain-containing protein n=1 Tax=Paenibacillus sp. E194 TaxID=1458845 RepID=UPI0005C9B5D9|nr:DUF948 domain-containing protein [Paenibacillus sp. E194]KJB85548.1 hypothetical protein AZ66_23965 [Paenibacillus sp. E194]